MMHVPYVPQVRALCVELGVELGSRPFSRAELHAALLGMELGEFSALGADGSEEAELEHEAMWLG